MNSLVIDNYIIETPLIDILQDIKDNLLNGKLARINKKGNYISVTCPNHSDGLEKQNSCGIYIGSDEAKYGRFNCFTCGTHGDFIHFVALCQDSSDAEAKAYLVKRYGKLISERTLELEPIILNKKEKVNNLDESVLDSFQSYHPYMEKRKLSRAVCEKFKIKYDPKSECIVFPVWDEKGKLCMLTRRSVNNKAFYIDKDKEKPIYLMNFIKERGIQEVTICESQINTLTLFGWGIPSVATFGCNITPKQIDILNKSNLNHVYVCYDGDAAGKKGAVKLLKGLNKNILVDIIVMPNGRDVNDLTEEEFNKLTIVEGQEWLRNESKD